MDILHIISWAAVLVLASSYWFQIGKIHVHKEVRDLSIVYHVLLALGFGVLIITAFVEKSNIFIVKQIATFIPVVIIIGQIIYHRRDTWHDDHDKTCKKCKTELMPRWKHCANCGKKIMVPIANK